MSYSECDCFTVGSRKWLICRNEAGLSAKKTNAYRKQWGLLALDLPDEHIVTTDTAANNIIPEFVFHGQSLSDEISLIKNKLYGPGTELLKIYEAAGVPTCDACKELAQQMNNWGVEKCREKIEKILEDIMPRAIEWVDKKYSWAMILIPNAIEEMVIYTKVKSDVLKAISIAESVIADRKAKKLNIFTGEKKSGGCSACGSKTKTKNNINRPRGGAFSFDRSEKPRFITSSQLQTDIKLLLSKMPSDITAIAGIARSGLSVATMLSMYLHLPMITIRQTMNDIVDTGNGWRLGGSKHISPKKEKILIVDDTVMTGNSIKAVRPLAEREFGEYLFAAVYVNPKAIHKPDIYAVDLPWPHILEWNVFNSVLSDSIAVDFDGILCYDCEPGSDDDGDKYLDFINNARPLYTPKKAPIPIIITARIEKYRKPTEQWLARNNITYKQLVMHPAKTLKERQKDDIPAYKARHFGAWLKSYRARIAPQIFFESEDWQARRMGQIIGGQGIIICPHTAGVYGS